MDGKDSFLKVKDKMSLDGILEDSSEKREISKVDIVSAHSSWLKSGSATYMAPGSSRPIECRISQEFEKLRGASFNRGQKLLSRLGFSRVESDYGRDFWSEPSEYTADSAMLVSYHTPRMHVPHWHMYLLWKSAVADVNPEGKVIGWHDDPNYLGLGRKDLNSGNYRGMRHIHAK